MTKKPFREIKLDALVVGMYITKLDIPWIDSPFLSNSKKIKSRAEISALKTSGVKTLFIDPNRGLDLTEPEAAQENAASPCNEIVHDNGTKLDNCHEAKVEDEKCSSTMTPDSKDRAKALQRGVDDAKKLREQVKKTINDLHKDLAAGSCISRETISPLIDQTLDSLSQNNQALLNVVHMSRRSQKLADHSFSTFCIALNIAQNQSLAADDIEALGIAALVHESGWTHLPINLMGKRLRYTPAEIKLIEKHPEIGIKSLAKSQLPQLSLRIVAEHHERTNGSGYPKKLRGEQIHPLSRLFAVVDQYDAMVHQLLDEPAKIPNVCLRELYVAGQKDVYDLESVQQLIALLGIYPISSAVQISDGRCAIVREVETNQHMTPLVEIIIDEDGKLVDTPYLVDLSATNESKAPLSITKVINPYKSDNASHAHLTLDI